MSLSGRNQRYVLKLSSTRLNQSAWNLTLRLSDARKNNEVVGIGESQLIRWLDELNGIENCEAKITEIKNNIENYRKQLRTDINIKPVLKSLYQQLDHYSFKKDYICVVIDKISDYRKLYKNGFVVNGIRYRRLLGTSGGIKLNTIIFINEQYLEEIKKRIANGRNLEKEFVPAKLEAYQALVCSSSIPVSMPKGIVCVPDCYTHFKADVIELDDSEDGEPKMSFHKDKECEQCANDGYGLGTPELLRKWGNDLGEDYILSGCVIRNAFCKGTIYPVDFRKFAHDNNCDVIIDSWGDSHNVDEVELILTESMLKLWDSYSSIYDYLDNCFKNHYTFSITKASEQTLENVRNMNYQFLQSYDFTDNDIENLILSTVNEIKDVLSNDWRKAICYTKGFNITEENVHSCISPDFATALMIEPTIIGDDFVQSQLKGMIYKRINDSKKGVLQVEGCYTLISGDPYLLCQSIFGLEKTGLLKSGEVYSQYWNNKNVTEAVMFRAPMTVHSNIRKMKVVRNEQMDEFYKYMTTPIIFNNFDTSPDAMNGFDYDGDCVITTNNQVLLDNTNTLPAVQCIQYKANKKIPTEDDIFESNILGFGNAVGGITNRVTSMFEVQARFPKDSKEYKIMDYRTACGQLFQQESIDAIKGIKSKPMPKYWYDFFATKPSEDDTEEDMEWKKFQRSIVADRKPYFFRYVYPFENTRWIKYIKDNNTKAIMQFGKDIEELNNIDELSKEQKLFLDNYYSRIPLGIAPCTINRICWMIEDIFTSFKMKKVNPFDYTLLKNDKIQYEESTYRQIEKIYIKYQEERNELDKLNHSQKIDVESYTQSWNELNNYFRREVSFICPNKIELCNILLDICYSKSINNKRFVWDICGDVIIFNLLEHNNYYINVPIQCDDGDFQFSGKSFVMKKIKLKKEETRIY